MHLFSIKRPFTLLEVMVVIGLLSLMGSVVAVRISSYLQKERERTKERIVASRYRLADRIATLFETQFTTSLQEGKLNLSPNQKIPDRFKAMITRPIKLPLDTQEKTHSPYGKLTDAKPQYPDEATLYSD